MVVQRVSNQILSEKTHAGKRRGTTLSSAAYFDAEYETTHTPRTSRDPVTHQIDTRSVTSAQQRRIRHQQATQITVYADMIKVSRPPAINGKRDRNPAQSGGIRGDVTGFSRASRKRMLEFMAKIRDVGDMYFVTMTYDDWSWLKKSDAHHSDFEAFRHRFERAFPNWKALWRIEVKERQSGDLKGWRVPHFHLLIFTGRTDDEDTKTAHAIGIQAWGVEAWGSILETENPHFSNYGFHVSAVRSRKHAYSYVSKYIGKQDDDDIPCGRRWGRIGVFDTSHSETIRLSDDEATYLRRLLKRWIRNRNPNFARRFAHQSCNNGYTIFGAGDTTGNGMDAGLFSVYNQFIVEVRRWSLENEIRECTDYVHS